MGSTFETKDSPSVTIFLSDEGEDICGNVYTFDICFCTHDCSVLAFKDIDVLKLSPSVEAPQQWKIASECGMTLKLVTGSMSFATIDEAFAALHQLAQVLPKSMEGSGGDSTTAAITMEQMSRRWCDPLDPFATKLRSLCPEIVVSPRFTSWEEVGKQLIEKNINNELNVGAALHRYANNKRDWERYVGATIVCRGQQDWHEGYTARVNVPMTLTGYFLYLARVCLPRVDKVLADATLVERSGGANRERLITDWFWHSLLASVCNSYIVRVFGSDTLVERSMPVDIRDIASGEMSYNNLRAVAFLYLIAHKVLAAALASLSGPAHVMRQRSIWQHRPKDSIAGDDRNDQKSVTMHYESDTCSSEWAEYHELLRDLTGAWFRAPLGEVMRCEEFSPGFCRAIAFELRNDVEISIWHRTIKQQLMMLEDSRWDGLFADRKGIWDDLREHRWKPLVVKIASIENAVADELETFAEWCEQYPELPAAGYGSADRFPERDCVALPVWEGRPDTLVAAIPNEEIDAWTYMVERSIYQAPQSERAKHDYST